MRGAEAFDIEYWLLEEAMLQRMTGGIFVPSDTSEHILDDKKY